VAARGPAPAPAAAEGGYAIQVGAFASAEAAQGLASRLRTAGYPVHVIAPERDDRWRVRVGPVASRDEADRTASRLKSEQALPTWVLREERS
jgi:DedD protein